MVSRKRIGEFISARKRFIVYSLAASVASFGAFSLFSAYYLFGYAPRSQRCLPYVLWIIERGTMPRAGEYITFKGKGIPLFPDGITWTKILAGTPGDRIDVVRITEEERRAFPGRYTEAVERNGMPVSINIQGYVILRREGDPIPQVYRVLEKDTRGTPVPLVEPQVIPHGKFFVVATAQRSFDSRYWGLVDESWIIGKAHPIL